jgi:hypothetical protein|uniref:Uncharacterized protein n=1 Tax=Caudovirales sp. ct7oE3 TaxID=2826768 RepID=A0A8S5M017_9CAUD|nr:MAG TPA: hypothetical protein [Caudovirales sp. ct7oE3]
MDINISNLEKLLQSLEEIVLYRIILFLLLCGTWFKSRNFVC